MKIGRRPDDLVGARRLGWEEWAFMVAREDGEVLSVLSR